MSNQDTRPTRTEKCFWFACVDIDVIRDKELSQSAKFIFTVLCTFINTNKRNCWPSNDLVAETACVSKSTVIRAYRELEARGVIARSKRFRSKDGSQTSSYTRLIGRCAKCYCAGSEEPQPTASGETTPMPHMPPKRNNMNYIKDSPTWEAELPNFADISLTFEDKEPVIPDEDK